jgi:hypothetical protein
VRWRRDRRDFDLTIWEAVIGGAEKLVDSGVDVEEALRIAVQAMDTSLDASTPKVIRTLMRSAPRMLRQRRRSDRIFRKQLRKHWGSALDLFLMVAVGAEESARRFDDEHTAEAVESGDLLFEALTGLQARACRIAFEIHHLLSGGFPMGALARCRTLHEIAVIAVVLSEYGPQDEHSDLAERFLLHEDVLGWKDAKAYEEHREVLGYQPLDEEFLTEITRRREELLERFGPSYREAYGWAATLRPGRRMTFVDLERLASLSHLRAHYAWESHEVHADATSLAMNVVETGEVLYKHSGPTILGLADPGELALISLGQCTVSLLMGTEIFSPKDLLSLKMLKNLTDKAVEAFGRGEETTSIAQVDTP